MAALEATAGTATMYHEKQYLMHCAVHTLNNLFQEPWATASLMEDIAKELFDREAAMRQESGMGRMWVNPYKSLVPQVGYYDINVLLEALKLKECHVSLHAVFNPKDPHAVARSLAHLDPNGGGVRGIVVNRVSKSLLGGLYTSHHFYAIVPWNKAYRSGNAGAVAAADTAAAVPPPETTGEAAPDDMETSAAAAAEGGEGEEEAQAAAAAAVAATAAAAAAAGAGAAGAADSSGDKAWFVVDSKSPHVEIIGGAAELALHLGMEARENQGHVFVVSDGTSEEPVVASDEMVAG